MTTPHSEKDPLAGAKRTLRERVLDRRNALCDADRAAASRVLAERFMARAEFSRARTVMAYASIESEVQTAHIIERTLHEGKRLVLPRVNRVRRQLDLFLIANLDLDLQPGTWGILEPNPERCEFIEGTNYIELVLVPGVAFTMRGERLGYGGGFYDRLLGAGRAQVVSWQPLLMSKS